MGSITEYLNKIITAVKGKDVRQSMHDAIKQVYDDAATSGNANMEVTLARGTEPNLNARLGKMDQVAETNTAQLADTAKKISKVAGSKIVAHRGLLSVAPENTLPAYEWAGKLGVKFVEADVLVTADGIPVLHHDKDIARMTDGTGVLESMTFAELQAFNIDTGTNVSKYPNLKIPTFKRFLEICQKYNMEPVVDMKTLKVEKVIEVLRASGYEHNCRIICDISNIAVIRALTSGNLSFYVSSLTENNISIALDNKCTSMSFHKSNATKENVDLLHGLGLDVAINTIYTYEEALRYINLNVDYITSESTAMGGVLIA